MDRKVEEKRAVPAARSARKPCLRISLCTARRANPEATSTLAIETSFWLMAERWLVNRHYSQPWIFELGRALKRTARSHRDLERFLLTTPATPSNPLPNRTNAEGSGAVLRLCA